jgi:ATP-dependent DNA ligase
MNRTFPTLYTKSRTGKLHTFDISVSGKRIDIRTGTLEGRKVLTQKWGKAKNIGRSNETSPEEQALLDAQSLWKKKLDRKYSLTPEDAQEGVFLPMLAKDYKNVKAKNISFPAFIQKKLDGVRCLAYWDVEEEEVVLMSREGKNFNVPHIKKQLRQFLSANSNICLDGEMYIHGTSLQTLVSWVKKNQEKSNSLEFHVFDCIDMNEPDMTFLERNELLSSERFLELNSFPSIIRVRTIEVKTFEDMLFYHRQFTEDDYEGTIYRNPNGAYEFGKRTNSLLKYKDFEDAEYKIVGFMSGEDSYSDCVIWICLDSATGETFKVNPKCSIAEKRRMYKIADQYVGKMLTVRFNQKTDADIPKFGRGIAFRDYE